MTERQPLWVALHLPAKQIESGSVSRVIGLLSDVVRSSTDLRYVGIEDGDVQICMEEAPQRLECLVRAARIDYEPWLADRRGLDLDQFLQQSHGRFLLLISYVQEDALVALLLDTDLALRFIHTAENLDEVEKKISREAVVAATVPTKVAGDAGLELFLRRFFDEDLASIFEAAGLRNRLARVEVEIEHDNTWIVLDGKRVQLANGTVRLDDVTPGRHTITVEREGYASEPTVLDVRPGSTHRVVPELRALPTRFAVVSRQVLLWSGVGMTVVGAGIMVAGLVATGPFELCGGAACEHEATFDKSGKTALVPVGYSLAGMGATWSLGALLGGEEDVPWIELAAGIVVFAASFTISSLLDGKTPCELRSDCIDPTGSLQ